MISPEPHKILILETVSLSLNRKYLCEQKFISNEGLNDDLVTIIESFNETTNVKIDIENLTYELKEDNQNNQ
jgi:hypothetical protein